MKFGERLSIEEEEGSYVSKGTYGSFTPDMSRAFEIQAIDTTAFHTHDALAGRGMNDAGTTGLAEVAV